MRNILQSKVVAEIGATHLGCMERAKNLIRLAALCGAKYAKLQKRNPEESVPEHLKNKPHPNAIFAYGSTYLEHRKNLEFSLEQHKDIKKYCEEIGIGYSTSVWDITSAREIISLAPDFIKVPSACNNNFEMLDILLKEYSGDIHISSGMTTNHELNVLLDYLERHSSRIVFYHTTSKYPCEFEDLRLLEIEFLRKTISPDMRLGFSNHGRGIAIDIAAYMLGAEWIERHFIDDRTIKHTDAAASLEPNGLSKLIRDLGVVAKSLTFKPDNLDEEEKKQREKLKKEI